MRLPDSAELFVILLVLAAVTVMWLCSVGVIT